MNEPIEMALGAWVKTVVLGPNPIPKKKFFYYR